MMEEQSEFSIDPLNISCVLVMKRQQREINDTFIFVSQTYCLPFSISHAPYSYGPGSERLQPHPGLFRIGHTTNQEER